MTHRVIPLLALLAAIAAAEPAPTEVARLGGDSAVMSLAVSPDGRRIAAGSTDTKVHVVDAGTGKVEKVLEPENGHVDAVAFSPDGKVLAAGGNTKLWMWSTETWEVLHVVDWRKGPFRTLEFSSDGKAIAARTFFGKAGLWNVADGKDLAEPRGAGFAAGFAGTALRLATVDRERRVRVWGSADGPALLEMEPLKAGEELPVGAFSPDGGAFAVVSADNKLRLWDMGGDRGAMRRDLPGEELPIAPLGPDLLLMFSPDGKWLAAEVGHEGAPFVRVWETRSGKQVLDLVGHRVPHFSGGGAVFLSTGGSTGAASRWDAAAQKDLPALSLGGGRIRAFAGGEKGKPTYAGGDGTTIVKWEEKGE